MKKTFAVLLAILFLCSFSLTSCADEADRIVGRWETRIEDESLGSVDMVYHFTENGNIFLEQKEGDTTPFSIPFGTWSLKGEYMTIVSNGEENRFTFSVSEDALILKQEGEEDLVFYKV